MSERLQPYQSCRSNEGWIPTLVPSESQGIDYTVMVCPWDHHRENICECKGYVFKGHCKHQLMAWNKICRWNELDGPEKQNEDQQKGKVCPRCNGPTSWQLEVIDE